MLLRTFSKNSGIPAFDAINYLNSLSEKQWSGSSNLSESEIIALNQYFNLNADIKVRDYSIKNSLNVEQVINALREGFEGINWLKTSPLQTNHLEYLNAAFPQSSEDIDQKQLNGSQPLKQLAGSGTEQIQQSESTSQLATTEESSIADLPLPKNLSPNQLAAFERFLQAEEITITASQDATEDRELYLTTYEKTLADLRVDSVKSTITRIKTNKAEFQKRQAERQATTEGKLAEDARFIAESQQWLVDFKAQNSIIF